MANETKSEVKNKRPIFLVRWFLAIKEYIVGSVRELKKVTWPTRKELFKSTWVVLVIVALMAIVTFGFDKIFDFITGLAYDLI